MEETAIFNSKELIDIFNVNKLRENTFKLDLKLSNKLEKVNKYYILNKYKDLIFNQGEEVKFIIDLIYLHMQEPYLGLDNLLTKGDDGYIDVCWELVSLSKNLTDDFINAFGEYLNWESILSIYDIDEKTLMKNIDLFKEEDFVTFYLD